MVRAPPLESLWQWKGLVPTWREISALWPRRMKQTTLPVIFEEKGPYLLFPEMAKLLSAPPTEQPRLLLPLLSLLFLVSVASFLLSLWYVLLCTFQINQCGLYGPHRTSLIFLSSVLHSQSVAIE